MGKSRPPIPEKVQSELLYINDMTCCICHRRSKPVVIHHIDGNRSNNSIDNLAVLCNDHHDLVHSKRSLTKNLTPHVLKKYKEHWELYNKNRVKIQTSPLQSKTGIEKILFEFEIRKTAYEILSLSEVNQNDLEEKLEYLNTINTLEGYTKEILQTIENISFVIAADDYKAAIIAGNLYNYAGFLWIGPSEISLTKEYKDDLFKIVEILRIIGSFSSEFNKNNDVIDNVLFSLDFLADISIVYDQIDLAKKIVDGLEKIIERGKIDLKKNDKFNQSITEINDFILQFKKRINKKKPKWDFKEQVKNIKRKENPTYV
jgi:hypothetical protein